MDKATAINNVLLTATALNFSSGVYADAPSTDPRYEELRRMMREYVQGVVREECRTVEDFNYEAYDWDNYEIKGLEVILFDILNHTANYCKPPELTGMHSAQRKVGESEANQ